MFNEKKVASKLLGLRNKMYEMIAKKPLLFVVLGVIAAGSVNANCGMLFREKGLGLKRHENRLETELSIRAPDGVKLSGTLRLPRDGSAKGILIPVHGSFVQTRVGSLDGSQKWMFPEGVPKRVIFDEFTDTVMEVGYGTFVYDKRASGKSGGDYAETTIETLAKDLKSVHDHLKALFPSMPVGVMGQSEGGLTILWAHRHLGFRPSMIILQSPALEPFDQTLEFQKTRAAKPFLSADRDNLARQYPYLVAFYDAMINGDMMQKIKETNDRYYTLKWGSWSYRTNLEKYRQYLFSGEQELRNVEVPVGLFIGGKDLNVNPEVAFRIREAKSAGDAYQQVDIFHFPELEHSFRHVPDGTSFVDAMKLKAHQSYRDKLKEFLLELDQ